MTVTGTTLEHLYGAPVWTWTREYTVTAAFTCLREGCGHTETVTAEVTRKNADEKLVFTATAVFQGKTYVDTKTTQPTQSTLPPEYNDAPDNPIPILPTQPRPGYSGFALASYTITVEERKGAELTTNFEETYPGTRIIVTVELEDGRDLEKLLVTDDDGTEIYVVPEIDGTYSFFMPSGNVTVKAVLKGDDKLPDDKLPFTDLTEDMDCYDDVQYVFEKGIMIGVSNTSFGPELSLTREMIVTILYRMEGKPAVEYAGVFSDVPAGQWYSDSVEWAASVGIVLGYGDGTYGINDDVTREQLATILYRYAKYKGYDVSVGENTNILSYDDALDTSEWAMAAVQWACGTDALNSGKTGEIRPTEPATRGEIAHAIRMFCEKTAE